MGRLNGKTVLVTGGASGIGRATVELLAREAARVIAADIDAARGRAVAAATGARFQHLDVTSEASWEAAFAGAGRIDALVNAAGIAGEDDGPETCTEIAWRRMLAVNLEGVFLGCKHGVRAMKGSGGAIVNLASVLAHVGSGSEVSYGASKGGVRMISRSTALYCAHRGYAIRCNSVCPGYTSTPMVEDWLARMQDGEEVRRGLIAMHPLGRLGKAQDIAAAILFLVSDDALYVTGTEVVVDGGFLAA
ncbi:MAG: SDR family oxidoreductase [Alphaproteobacteria bacterium]|nr:SDR family oxidoreductase [Alphaproteobacteria bacterium]